jgi:hypothetical protein
MAWLANDTAVEPRRRLHRAKVAQRNDSRQPLRGAQAGSGRVGVIARPHGADRFRHALTATGINQPAPGG